MSPKIGYTIDEAAQALGIGRTKLYELMDSGQVENVKIGRRRVIPVDSLSAYLQRLRVQQAPPRIA